MLLKKTAWFWKTGLMIISLILISFVSGCSDENHNIPNDTSIDVEVQSDYENIQDNDTTCECSGPLCWRF